MHTSFGASTWYLLCQLLYELFLPPQQDLLDESIPWYTSRVDAHSSYQPEIINDHLLSIIVMCCLVEVNDTIQLLISHISDDSHQTRSIQTMIQSLPTNVQNISNFGPYKSELSQFLYCRHYRHLRRRRKMHRTAGTRWREPLWTWY